MREIYGELLDAGPDLYTLRGTGDAAAKWGDSAMIHFSALAAAVMSRWLSEKIGTRYDPLRRHESEDGNDTA